jgi:hypothetical protein
MSSVKTSKTFSGPAWANEELEKVRNTVLGWSRSKRLNVFAKGGSRVTRVLKKFPRNMWNFTAKKGNWCITEVLWHLADQEANIYVRFRKAISENGAVVSAWDHTKWQKETLCAQAHPLQAQDLILFLREANADLLRRMPTKAWKNYIKHPEFGKSTVEDMVDFNIWHLDNHIGQMERRFLEWNSR